VLEDLKNEKAVASCMDKLERRLKETPPKVDRSDSIASVPSGSRADEDVFDTDGEDSPLRISRPGSAALKPKIKKKLFRRWGDSQSFEDESPTVLGTF